MENMNKFLGIWNSWQIHEGYSKETFLYEEGSRAKRAYLHSKWDVNDEHSKTIELLGMGEQLNVPEMLFPPGSHPNNVGMESREGFVFIAILIFSCNLSMVLILRNIHKILRCFHTVFLFLLKRQ